MGRISKATTAARVELIDANGTALIRAQGDLTPELQGVIAEIDNLFGDIQVASLTAFWRVGRLIATVEAEPEKYLTAEQVSAQINGAALLISIFAPVYTAEQLRGAVSFFDKYPTEDEIARLLSLRCPERPRWRLTTSHVQLLAQIPSDQQRLAIEEKCAEEAFTAKTLAAELQEIRGKQKGGGRTHQSPRGLKQQVFDLLQHQRRFLDRSASLWLCEDKTNLYDAIANAPPASIDETVRGYLTEILNNFSLLTDVVADHISAFRSPAVGSYTQEPELEQEPEQADAPGAAGTKRHRRTGMTR